MKYTIKFFEDALKNTTAYGDECIIINRDLFFELGGAEKKFPSLFLHGRLYQEKEIDKESFRFVDQKDKKYPLEDLERILKRFKTLRNFK